MEESIYIHTRDNRVNCDFKASRLFIIVVLIMWFGRGDLFIFLCIFGDSD